MSRRLAPWAALYAAVPLLLAAGCGSQGAPLKVVPAGTTVGAPAGSSPAATAAAGSQRRGTATTTSGVAASGAAGSQRGGTAAATTPASGVAASSGMMVYVVGAVARPGVYPLPPGSRVQDAIKAAGGFLPGADMVRVNLAARVRDEEEIFVPLAGQGVPLSASPGAGLNVNTAGAARLHSALGISTTLARKIVAYREAHGPFASVDDLSKVPVPSTELNRIRGAISLG
ncbi:MAG: helix-hairpin-helix domain-containing protein [Chloroflexota bacterium]